jgi:hypothetical protein
VRKALVVLAPLLLGACSLLLGEGFSTPDSPAADGSTDGADIRDGAGSADVDAAEDARSSIDGGGDGGNICNLQGSFCDDFNRAPALLKGDWDTVHLVGDAGVSLVAATGGVGARLESTINAGGGSNATLEKDFSTPQTPAKQSRARKIRAALARPQQKYGRAIGRRVKLGWIHRDGRPHDPILAVV